MNYQDFDIAAFGPKETLFQKLFAHFAGKYCHIGFVVTADTASEILNSIGFNTHCDKRNYYIIHATLKHRMVSLELLDSVTRRFGYVDFYRVSPSNELFHDMMKVYCATSLFAVKYDVSQLYRIFAKMMKIPYFVNAQMKVERVVCSEFVAKGLVLCAGIHYPKDLDSLTPDEVVLHKQIKRIHG